MHALHASLILPFLFTPTFPTLASPLPNPSDLSTSLGSKHTLYLVTCKPRHSADPEWPRCPLIILCPLASRRSTSKRQAGTRTFTAISYYASGPISDPSSEVPTSFTVVTDPAGPWEGTQRVAKVGLGGRNGQGAFSANINRGAGFLEKGQMSGEAKIDSEDFVCFRDGVTEVGGGGGGGRGEVEVEVEAECWADYWCASIDV